MPLHIAVLLGSVRSDRLGSRPARYIQSVLEGRGHQVTLVDPMVVKLPLLDRMYKEYPPGGAPVVLEELARLYRSVDGFVIVSGEYNNGIPPALKNLLDHFLEEYFWRPSAIVCYSAGRFGGIRAAMQLRMVLAELGMSSIPSILPFGGVQHIFDEHGAVQDEKATGGTMKFVDELEWYAAAMRAARAGGVPY